MGAEKNNLVGEKGVTATENVAGDDAKSTEQTFKSTEIYKSRSQQKTLKPLQPTSFLEKVKKYKLAIIWSGVGLLLIIVIIILATQLINSDTGESSEEAATTITTTGDSTNDETPEEIAYDTEIVDDETAQQVVTAFDQLIEAESDNAEKAYLYLERAAQFYDSSDELSETIKAQILSDAHQAEALDPTAENAYAIYFYESELGDASEAEKYYNLAIERDPEIVNGEG